MQISNATAPFLYPANRQANSSSFSSLGSESSSDQAVLNTSASSFLTLVNEAKSFPEVRSEVVDFYKSQIRSNHYPSEDIVAGLTRLMGGSFDQISGSSKK